MEKQLLKEFLTVKEVAELLNVHSNTIRNLCKQGQLCCIKVGRQYRIPRFYLENFFSSLKLLEENKKTGAGYVSSKR